MSGRYYYLLASLPDLPALGETPPLELATFAQMASQEPAALPLIEALLLDYDLVLRLSLIHI